MVLVGTHVESAWLQQLKLHVDELLESLDFNFTVWPYNQALATKSEQGLKTVCGLPLSHECARVSVDDIAGGGERRECDPARFGVKAGVKVRRCKLTL